MKKHSSIFGAEVHSAKWAEVFVAPWSQFPPGGGFQPHFAPWRHIPCTKQALTVLSHSPLLHVSIPLCCSSTIRVILAYTSLHEDLSKLEILACVKKRV